MKILFIGPGIMPIPPHGWGAVERIIWEQKLGLEERGHSVDVVNKQGAVAALRARPWRYDVIHVQREGLTRLWLTISNIFRVPLLLTPHYGYAAHPEKWGEYYEKSFPYIKKCKNLIVLSAEIKSVFIERGYTGNIWVLPNGSNVGSFAFKQKGNGRAICLGKIQPRKKQALLARLIAKDPEINCDFVGPLADENFKTFSNSKYLGEWSREKVYKHLTDYSCLILSSDGEAHSLVVAEALAAGLSIIITPQAAAHLDTTKPWIHVYDSSKEIVKAMSAVCAENNMHRTDIKEYAQANFDWSQALPKYEAVLEEVAAQKKRQPAKSFALKQFGQLRLKWLGRS